MFDLPCGDTGNDWKIALKRANMQKAKYASFRKISKSKTFYSELQEQIEPEFNDTDMDNTEETTNYVNDNNTEMDYKEGDCKDNDQINKTTLNESTYTYEIQNYTKETRYIFESSVNNKQEGTEEREFNRIIGTERNSQAKEEENTNEMDQQEETELDESRECTNENYKLKESEINESTEYIEQKDLSIVARKILDKINRSLAKSSVTKAKFLNQREETIIIELDKSVVQDFLTGLTLLERLCNSGSWESNNHSEQSSSDKTVHEALLSKTKTLKHIDLINQVSNTHVKAKTKSRPDYTLTKPLSTIKAASNDNKPAVVNRRTLAKQQKEIAKRDNVKRPLRINVNKVPKTVKRNFKKEDNLESHKPKMQIERCNNPKKNPIRTTRIKNKSREKSPNKNRPMDFHSKRRSYRKHPDGWDVIIGENGGPPFKCPICPYQNNLSKTATKRHMVVHMPDELCVWYKCDQCDYKSKRPNSLKSHQLTHKSDKDIDWSRCTICPAKFKQKSGLQMHLIRHKNKDECGLYKCDSCDYSTPFRYTIKRHVLTHKTIGDTDHHYKCHVCSYVTLNRFYLSRHLKSHEEPTFKCALCSYSAHWKPNLDNHMISHNREEFLIECDFCDFTTVRNYSMKKHMRKIHQFIDSKKSGTTELLQCANCDYSTRLKRCLVSHMVMHIKPKHEF